MAAGLETRVRIISDVAENAFPFNPVTAWEDAHLTPYDQEKGQIKPKINLTGATDGVIVVINAPLFSNQPGGASKVVVPGVVDIAQHTECTVIRPFRSNEPQIEIEQNGRLTRKIDTTLIPVGQTDEVNGKQQRNVRQSDVHLSHEEWRGYYADVNDKDWFFKHADTVNAGRWNAAARPYAHIAVNEVAIAIVKQIAASKNKRPLVLVHDYQLDRLLPLKLAAAWNHYHKSLPAAERNELPKRIPIGRFGHTPELTMQTIKKYAARMAAEEKKAWDSFSQSLQPAEREQLPARPPKIGTQDFRLLSQGTLDKFREHSGFELGSNRPTKAHLRRYMSNLLSCDVIGCQTEKDANLIVMMAKSLGYQVQEKQGLVLAQDLMGTKRWARVAAFPVSVDHKMIEKDAANPEANMQIAKLMHETGFDIPDFRVIASVQRRDTTKNIVGQVQAFAALLEKHEELRGKVGFFLVACDTRKDVETEAYSTLKAQVRTAVDAVNEKFRKEGWTPIQYQEKRALEPREVAALYSRPEVVGAIALSALDGHHLGGEEFHAAKRKGGLGKFIVTRGCGASYSFEQYGSEIIEDYTDTNEISDAMSRVLKAPEAELIESHRVAKEGVENYSAVDQNQNLIAATINAAANRFNSRQQVSPGEYLPKQITTDGPVAA